METSLRHPYSVLSKCLSFSFPDQEQLALSDVTLSIAGGECIALMGPNGCGKTTLAKLLAGLIYPFTGDLNVLGEDLATSSGRRAVRGRVGLVFQSPDDQMVATTVEREIAFGPENLGLADAEIRRRVDVLLKRFELQHYAQRSPHALSGGEKQRLAIASILAMEPDFLIFDEVTSLLDPVGRSEVLKIINELKGHRTLLLITQFPGEALIADRLILMREGLIIKDAVPEVVFTAPEILTDPDFDVPFAFRLMEAAGCTEDPLSRK